MDTRVPKELVSGEGAAIFHCEETSATVAINDSLSEALYHAQTGCRVAILHQEWTDSLSGKPTAYNFDAGRKWARSAGQRRLQSSDQMDKPFLA